VERPAQRRPAGDPKRDQAGDDQPYGKACHVAGADLVTASGKRQPPDQGNWGEQRRRFL
jgi:hypothetical protein